MYNNGEGIFIGVAPSDIDQNEKNCEKCGWYFYCYGSILYSGPPHNYNCKEHGSKEYVRTGEYSQTTKSKGERCELLYCVYFHYSVK